MMNEFIPIAETIITNPNLFLAHLMQFLSCPDIIEMSGNKKIRLDGNIRNKQYGKVYIIGDISGLLAYIEIKLHEVEEFPEQTILTRTLNETLSKMQTTNLIHPLMIDKTSRMGITESFLPTFSERNIYLVRLFVRKNAPPEFIGVLSNFIKQYNETMLSVNP